MTDERRMPAGNSTYTQVGVQCFYESEVLNQSSVILMKFSGKSPHLRVAAKRYAQAKIHLKDRFAAHIKLMKEGLCVSHHSS